MKALSCSGMAELIKGKEEECRVEQWCNYGSRGKGDAH